MRVNAVCVLVTCRFFSPINCWDRLQQPSWPSLRISGVIHTSKVWMDILIYTENTPYYTWHTVLKYILFNIIQCFCCTVLTLWLYFFKIFFFTEVQADIYIPFFCHWRHHYCPHHDDAEHQCTSFASQGLICHSDGLVHRCLLRLCLLSSYWICCCKLLYWWTD